METVLKRKREDDSQDAHAAKRLCLEGASDLTCFSPPHHHEEDDVADLKPATSMPIFLRGSPLLDEPKRRQVKILNLYVELSELEWRIVDTPHFAAKRKIKQMGACIYAFPCATETRWMHQLLVRYFSNMTICLFRQHQPHLNITDKWVQAVNIAALCHDIGHVSFSHLADAELFRTFTDIPEVMRDHETRGTLLFEWMNRHYKFGLDDEQVRLIQHLITGKVLDGYPGWLFDIVNARNTFDVDKLAYLHSNAIASHGHVRDLQVERILSEMRVLSDEIMHPRKMFRLLIDVLHHRKLAFSELYRHKLTSKAEAILICIFKHMAKALEWKELLMDPESDNHAWCEVLTDAAIDDLPSLVRNPALYRRLSDEQRKELDKAYALSMRLDKRDWFATVEEMALVRQNETSRTEKEAGAVSNTIAFSYTIGYSNNANNNPIDRIKLFTKKQDIQGECYHEIETLRAVLESEQGTNAHYEQHRTVIANEDA